jgi:hypothetical protein
VTKVEVSFGKIGMFSALWWGWFHGPWGCSLRPIIKLVTVRGIEVVYFVEA